MYSESKYVVGMIGGFEAAIVIPETVTHSDVRCIFDEVLSAGFCHYSSDKVVVYGESVSLRVKSRPEDARFVGRAMAHPEYIC